MFDQDFTEVDNNVTRHVPDALQQDDWTAMVVHYLGLDHIGHKTGPQGPNMLPKQREMDGIVRLIYEAMESTSHHQNTLLVLAGDHGMNAGGNHGGSGPGETEPALLFASPKLKTRQERTDLVTYECPTLPKDGTEFHYYSKIQQSDLVPTITGLLGLPIPKNSLGVYIDEMHQLWQTLNDRKLMIYRNGMQVKRILQAKVGIDAFATSVSKFKQGILLDQSPPSSDEDLLAYHWAAAELAMEGVDPPTHDGDQTSAMTRFLDLAQDYLSNAASSYKIPYMIAGILLNVCSLILALLGGAAASWPPTPAGVFFVLTTTLYGVMMFASSYVEEEQHFWYWITPGWIFILAVRRMASATDRKRAARLASAAVALLAVHRFAERWNQTGQKHSGDPDIVHAFFPQNHILMWTLILASYSYVGIQVARTSLANIIAPEVAAVVAAALIVPALVFKLNFTQADAPELVRELGIQIREWTATIDLVQQAQLAFFFLGMTAGTVILGSVGPTRSAAIAQKSNPAQRFTLPQRLHYLLTLFLMIQSRAPNAPLFLGLEIQRWALRTLLAQPRTNGKPGTRHAPVPSMDLSTSALLFSHVYFFCMGGSNSISSVDLSNAYNGVAVYNIVAVGVLLFASNWSGPIWWCSAAVTLTFSERSSSEFSTTTHARSWVAAERQKLKEVADRTVPFSGQEENVSETWRLYVVAMTAFVASSLIAVMATCTLLRTHLFIWTVFSPKYLYAMAWAVGWHLLVNIGFGGLLRYLGRIS